MLQGPLSEGIALRAWELSTLSAPRIAYAKYVIFYVI